MAARDDTRLALYLDEDVPDRLALALRERGIDALSTSEAGRIGDSDEAQLAFAADERRTLLTYNQGDFIRLAKSWYERGMHHSGIIVSGQFGSRQLGELIRLVTSLVNQLSAEEARDTVRFLQRYR